MKITRDLEDNKGLSEKQISKNANLTANQTFASTHFMLRNPFQIELSEVI